MGWADWEGAGAADGAAEGALEGAAPEGAGQPGAPLISGIPLGEPEGCVWNELGAGGGALPHPEFEGCGGEDGAAEGEEPLSPLFW